MLQNYQLEQWIWAESDFDRMGWHDCPIYAMAFPRDSFELVLDIDYIFKWVQPTPPDRSFKLWIAPATLVFENVRDPEFGFDQYNGMEIDSIERKQSGEASSAKHVEIAEECLWTISCHGGDINLRSTGFKQYIRSAPELSGTTRLDLNARGGYSFARGRVK